MKNSPIPSNFHYSTLDINDENQKQWDRVVSHPLQSWQWGEFRKSMGIPIERIGIYKENKLIDGWQITFHKIPKTPFTVGYFPKGPKITNEMIEQLKKVGKKHNTIFIQIEPNIQKNSIDKYRTAGIASRDTKQISNLIPSHHPLFTKYTFQLDLTKSEDDLLQTMHHKTRYNIKIAKKHNVTITEDNSKQAFLAYLRLEKETTTRQKFFAHSLTYHETMWKYMKNDIAKLFIATYQDKILSAWILFCFKDILYYPYGSSSSEYRNVMAPTLMLWETARWGKKNGFKIYDLWGSMGPNPNELDPFFGFHHFKQGFNPMLIEFIGSFDLVLNPIPYQLYKVADVIRWKLLKK
jgi:lipid II:glycine glycyltransferase (peptidoglycan interpeptide bridge formation enzyme)